MWRVFYVLISVLLRCVAAVFCFDCSYYHYSCLYTSTSPLCYPLILVHTILTMHVIDIEVFWARSGFNTDVKYHDFLSHSCCDPGNPRRREKIKVSDLERSGG